MLTFCILNKTHEHHDTLCDVTSVLCQFIEIPCFLKIRCPGCRNHVQVMSFVFFCRVGLCYEILCFLLPSCLSHWQPMKSTLLRPCLLEMWRLFLDERFSQPMLAMRTLKEFFMYERVSQFGASTIGPDELTSYILHLV